MRRYDDIVVGSGISGLTFALLLGMDGRRVLLLEKAPRIGGSLARFRRQGIPFDTGFHFTGGFSKDGVLYDMLTVLGIRDRIQPVFLAKTRFIFASEDRAYDMPAGLAPLTDELKGYFPGEATAIDQYFKMVQEVCAKTISLDLNKITLSPPVLDEDFVSLREVLDGLTQNPSLRGLLGGYSMCYGARPAEISFANHSRVCLGLYESIARVRDGGQAFVTAFQDRLAELGIEVLCNSHIAECVDIHDRRVGRFVLNSGEEVAAENCVFTIHPKEILKTLPETHLTKAFIDRVSEFEASAGFFSVFGTVRHETASDVEPSIVSLFPTPDIDELLDPAYDGTPALVILPRREEHNGTSFFVLDAFEPSSPRHVAAWQGSTTGNRPPGYTEYKQQHVDRIRARVLSLYPEYRDSYEVLDAASMLTFRDYLHSPDGSAYGVKQKIGQYNLLGRLPLRNLFAAGQSSVLPGIVGAMMSSFIAARSIIGKDRYSQFIGQRLCS